MKGEDHTASRPSSCLEMPPSEHLPPHCTHLPAPPVPCSIERTRSPCFPSFIQQIITDTCHTADTRSGARISRGDSRSLERGEGSSAPLTELTQSSPEESNQPPPCHRHGTGSPRQRVQGWGSGGERPCPTHSTASEPGDVSEFGDDTGGGEGGRGQHESLGATAVFGHQPHVARLGCLSPHQLELSTLGGQSVRSKVRPMAACQLSLAFSPTTCARGKPPTFPFLVTTHFLK